jgi:hypothetical protein
VENGEMIAVKKLGENSPVANEKTFSKVGGLLS